MFRAAKDLVASNAAFLYLDKRVEPYGKLQDLKIDSRNRTLRLVCLPHGETTAVTVDIHPYLVTKADGKTWIEAQGCTCSRLWLERLLNDFVRGRRFELPSWAASAL